MCAEQSSSLTVPRWGRLVALHCTVVCGRVLEFVRGLSFLPLTFIGMSR